MHSHENGNRPGQVLGGGWDDDDDFRTEAPSSPRAAPVKGYCYLPPFFLTVSLPL